MKLIKTRLDSFKLSPIFNYRNIGFILVDNYYLRSSHHKVPYSTGYLNSSIPIYRKQV